MKKIQIVFLITASLLLWGCAAEPTEEETPAEPAEEEMATDEDQPADAARGTAELTLDGKKITVEYGRPSLAGRDMLAQLEVGAPWRLGMNAATTLDTEATLVFGDKTVSPGRYRLWAMKTSPEEWILIASSDMGRYDESNDVARIPLTTGENDEQVETFTINLESTGDDSGRFVAMWDMLKVSAEFAVQ